MIQLAVKSYMCPIQRIFNIRRICYLVLIITITFLYIHQAAFSATPSRITLTEMDEVMPSMSISPNNETMVVWVEQNSETWDIVAAYYSKSFSFDGATISNTSNTTLNQFPSVTYGNGKFLVVWVNRNITSMLNEKAIHYATYSPEEGWTNASVLYIPSNDADISSTTAIFNGTHFVVCWLEFAEVTGMGIVGTMKCSWSSDGDDWNNETEVRIFSSDTSRIVLTYYGGKYILSWIENNVCNVVVGDRLESLKTGGSVVTHNVSNCMVISNSTNLLAIYSHQGDIHYSFYSSTNGWSSSKYITTSTANDEDPFLYYDSSNDIYYVVWRSDREGNDDIYTMQDSTVPIEELEIYQPVCGDGICESGENSETCPDDCKSEWVDPCQDVTCPDKCVGTTYYSDGICDSSTGDCMYLTIIENADICEESTPEPETPPQPPVSVTETVDPCQDVTCPDKCVGTTYYSDGICISTTGECEYLTVVYSSPLCAGVEEDETVEIGAPTETTQPSKETTVTECPDKCVGTTYYSDGYYNVSLNKCVYKTIENNSVKCGWEEKRELTILYPEDAAIYTSSEVKFRAAYTGSVQTCLYSLNNGLNSTLANDTDLWIYPKEGENKLDVYCRYKDGEVIHKSVIFYTRFKEKELETEATELCNNATKLITITITEKKIWHDELNRTYISLEGEVQDTEGTPVPNLKLEIYDGVTNQHVMDVTTDENGEFKATFRAPSYTNKYGEARVDIIYPGGESLKSASVTETLSLKQTGATLPSSAEQAEAKKESKTKERKWWMVLILILLIVVVIYLLIKYISQRKSEGENESGGSVLPPQPYNVPPPFILKITVLLFAFTTIFVTLNSTTAHAAPCSEVGVKWTTARYGPIHPFTSSHGSVGSTYCTTLNSQFTYTETFNFRLNPSDPSCRGCCEYWCYYRPGRDCCTRYRGWYANKIKERGTRWKIRLIGTTEHADCCYGCARCAAVDGELYVNTQKWSLARIPQCSVIGGYSTAKYHYYWKLHIGTSSRNSCR